MTVARITKIGRFEYAHRIMNHPGKCANLHGHSGKVEITVTGEVSEETGMVLDFEVLSDFFKSNVDRYLDHATLLQEKDEYLVNFVYQMQGKQPTLKPPTLFALPPTAEEIATFILDRLEEYIRSREVLLVPQDRISSYKVKLWETETSYVEVTS